MKVNTLIILAVFLFGVGSVVAQPWNYDFGTGTGSLTAPGSSTSSSFANPNDTLFPAEPPSGGGTYNGFVSSSGGGGLYCLNPGLSDFGSGTEFRMEAPTTTGNGGINKYAVNTYSSATRIAYLRHNVRFGNSSGGSATSGNFYFVWGTPNSANSFNDNNLPNIENGNDGEVFVGMKVAFNANGTLTCNYLVPGAKNGSTGTWTGTFDSQPFVRGTTYTVEYFMYGTPQDSGSSTYDYNGSSVTINKYTWHVYVNGVRAYSSGDSGEFSGGGVKKNSNLTSFMFYGESSTSNACMFLDNSYYNNSFTFSYTDFYSKSTGNLDQYSTWGSNPDGSGSAPLNFSTAGITYHIQNNPSPTLGAARNVSGTGHKVILGDGVSTCNFTIPASYAMTGTVNVNNLGILDIQNVTLPTLGTLANGSTVRYNYAGNQNVKGSTYYTLEIANRSNKTMLGDTTVTNLVFSGGNLALNNHNLYLAGKYISFYSSNALFSALTADYTDNYVSGQGVGRIWSTNGSLTNSVDMTLTFPYATTPATMYLWYKVDGGVWTKGALVTPSYAGGNATVTLTGLTSLAGTGAKGNMEWTFAETDATLPVELSSFTALFSNLFMVTLQWVTQSETNVSGFRVYRSTEADLSTATMLNIFVPATNTSQMQVYVVSDEEVYQDGTYYYWLENLDMDGSSTLHGPISITVSFNNTGSPSVPLLAGLNKAYPNPFHPEVTLELGMEKAGWADVEIYNLKGQKVRTLYSGNLDKGNQTLRWDSKDDSGKLCANGVYFAIMRTHDGKVSSMKLTLMK